MEAMVIRRTGGPEVFEHAHIPTPEPEPGDVLIEVVCAGVNPADWKNRAGLLAPFRPYKFPYVIGFDAAGTVAAVTKGVTGFAPGDRVITPTNHGQGGQGSYARYTLARADRVAQIPGGMAFAEAAALPVPALTAWQAIHNHGDLGHGDRVLVHGGSGCVGAFAVQFARRAGAKVAATCSEQHIGRLKALGVDRAIDYRSGDIDDVLQAWSPGGVDYLVNTAGASTLPDAIAMVRPGGRLVSIPTLVDDGDPDTARQAALDRGVEPVFGMMDDNNCSVTLETILQLVQTGDIELPPIKRYPLTEVAQVHRQLESSTITGKVVLDVS